MGFRVCAELFDRAFIDYDRVDWDAMGRTADAAIVGWGANAGCGGRGARHERGQGPHEAPW